MISGGLFSFVHSSRLETRTKESYSRASQGLLLKVHGETKVNGVLRVASGLIPWPMCRGRKPGVRYTSVSTRSRLAAGTLSPWVSTRKMVIYAQPRRSQGKLWWRSAAFLTCKSIVRVVYRGDRLIEPSSSWFPPKFPSG